MKNLTTLEPNYIQIYFPYSTVTSACQGSGPACTQTVSILRTLTYMYADAFLSPKQTILHRHGPINHGLATPFLSYRVTLNARKMRNLFEINHLAIVQTLCQCSDS